MGILIMSMLLLVILWRGNVWSRVHTGRQLFKKTVPHAADNQSGRAGIIVKYILQKIRDLIREMYSWSCHHRDIGL